MQKPWLKSYPTGIKEEIDINAYSSVANIFDSSVAQFGELPAYTNFGKTLSFHDADIYTAQLGAYLKNELGLVKGDRVAVMMPNLLQNPIAIFAILRAGLVVVNTNPLYTTRELKHQLNDSGAKAIIIVENFANVLEKVIDETQIEKVITTKMGDMLSPVKGFIINTVVKYIKKMVPAYHLKNAITFKQALKLGAQHRFQTVATNHEDIAFLQYTGGTTGVSKGAILTNKNMVSNVSQASEWIRPFIGKEKSTIITALPLYHIFSLTANCLTFMRYGWCNYLITNPRDINGFVKELKKTDFRVFTGVNTLFNGLLNHPDFKTIDFSKFLFALGGGMAVQRGVAERWREVTGTTLIEAYGLTETSPAACMNPMNLKEFNGKIGLPISSTEVSMQDDDWNEVALGEHGEICIRGPQVMKGYWQRPKETSNVLSNEGWLHTGDIGFIDESGFVQIVDRKKDMILVSGFNVFPNEVEEVLAGHPDVVEVGVIGKPDEHSGEVVMAVVVKSDDSLTEETLRDFCRKGLTSYKVPKSIIFTDELPKTNVGKILRRELRDKYITGT
ncbi:Long-chain-fatty-acid--CoA ligase [hydrothermal vent metagenome]|uniref:Long-chain-fatty-acid--CoA ligase n=1 Tax=hydrothermal vent metagenome TaxID=652676 RepID=A0A3B0WSB2_9ZZZZ